MEKEKSPNLNTCTHEEFADWLQHVKEAQGVVMHHTGFYTYDQLYTLAEAFRIFGQREGYKKGKRDGSGSTFNHFFRSKTPCQICRYRPICDKEKHSSKCDVWLRWIGVK